MIKRLLLLLLCAPLGVVLYHEGRRLFAQYIASPFAAGGLPDELDKSFKDGKEAAAGVERLKPDLGRAVCVSDEAPRPDQDAADAETVPPALRAYPKALADTRFVLSRPSKADWEQRFPKSHPFRSLLEKDQALAELEKKIKGTPLKDSDDRAVLVKLLEQYKMLHGHNPNLYAERHAAAARYDLEDPRLKELDRLREEAFLSSKYGPSAVFKKKLESAVKALLAFQRKDAVHPAAKLHGEWAEERLRECTYTQQLAELVDLERGLPIDKILAGLGALSVEFRKQEASPALRTLVKRLALAQCERSLPPKLKLDDYVGVWIPADQDYRAVPRSEVWILWTGKPKQRLSESDYDEYGLPDVYDQITRLSVNGKARGKDLKALGRSPAVHGYNAHRSTKEMKWTLDYLGKFVDFCRDHEKYLNEPLQVLRQLQAALRGLPEDCELFAAK